MSKPTKKKRILGLLCGLAATFGALALTPATAPADEAVHEGHQAPLGRVEWDKAAVSLFAELPVQNGGRVKPLSTYAGFLLLKLNGRRKLTTPEGHKLKPTEWLMDCLFQPQLAARQEVFLIENADVLDAIGVKHETKKRRDRYAYVDLENALQKLFQLSNEYRVVDERERSVVQSQVILLAHNVGEFQLLRNYFDFARTRYDTGLHPPLTEALGDADPAGLADVLAHAGEIQAMAAKSGMRGHGGHAPADKNDMERAAIGMLMRAVQHVQSRSILLALFPPAASSPADAEWFSAATLTAEVMNQGASLEPQIEALAQFEALWRNRKDKAAFLSSLEQYHEIASGIADQRGEYDKIALEVSYYKGDYFTNGLVIFLLTFLLVGCTWLWPDNKWLRRGVWGGLSVGTLLVVVGITMRCIIRSRPPVTTLYETILFITATAVVAAMVIEWINGQRIANAFGAILGTGGLFLAQRYEMSEAVDTMPALIAVLDTNYWLALHVTTITIGYAAGLFAGGVSHLWILGSLFGVKRGDRAFYKSVSRMVYGLLCFSLLFSVVGTVLGGIWANESWGRFWGWDPKENGALLICLWQLLILHARLGGYIKDFGLHMLSVVGASVVVFSWWGVNLLGVGLHSYGFTSGIMAVLLIYAGIEGLVLLCGGIHWAIQRNLAAEAAAGPPTPPVPPTPPSAPTA